jgi:hypothetical protein
MRFWAVIKLRSTYEAEVPVEGMGRSHLRRGGDEHLSHALRAGTIQAGIDQRAPDAATPSGRRHREHPELRLIKTGSKRTPRR